MDGPPIFEAGTIIDGRYRITRRLGRGGFATVYEAEHLQLGRLAALKVLEPVAPHITERFQARFNTEARIAANLDHPNVVRIFDFGFIPPDARPYMAMELLDGYDLEVYLHEHGAIEPARARRMFLPVIDALRLGHERGIVHKDLKPSNLFMVREGQPDEKLVVLDYGIARLEGDENPRYTEEGTYTGTPAYMPPEYINRREVTPAYDIYQIGLIFIEAMTGQPVVVAGSNIAYMVAHVEGKHRIPEGFGDTPLGAALIKAIAVEPERRYANGGEMYAAIDFATVETGADFTLPAAELSEAEEEQISEAGDRPRTTRTRTPPAKALPIAALVIALCAVALLGCVFFAALGGAYFWASSSQEEDELEFFQPPTIGLTDSVDDTNEPPMIPTMPNIAPYSDEGMEMNAWLMARYMILTTLNQVALYEDQLAEFGGWTAQGFAFVPSGTDDLLDVAVEQIQIGMMTPPQRAGLEQSTAHMMKELGTLQQTLSDLYDYHSVRRGWESDGGAHGKTLSKNLHAITKNFVPKFDRWSANVDDELRTHLAARETALADDPFLALATAAMSTQHRLILAMAKNTGSVPSNEALSHFDAALAALQKHVRANQEPLMERYALTGGLHNRYVDSLKDTLAQASELRAEAKKGENDPGDATFLWMQLHMTFDTFNQLQRF